MWEQWDHITSNTWGNPYGPSVYRAYSQNHKLWEFDERGSLNAVYAFLRDQGVRWYMPGELGEILPRSHRIAVPKSERTVRPDFGLRYMHMSFFSFEGWDDMLWSLRLGLNSSSEATGWALVQSHGMEELHRREAYRIAHPDYFAVWGGKRMNLNDQGKPCLSSPGLFEDNVRYLRALIDTYDFPMVSCMPADGFGSMCECALCEG